MGRSELPTRQTWTHFHMETAEGDQVLGNTAKVAPGLLKAQLVKLREAHCKNSTVCKDHDCLATDKDIIAIIWIVQSCR